jgi:hypothetical protein
VVELVAVAVTQATGRRPLVELEDQGKFGLSQAAVAVASQ